MSETESRDPTAESASEDEPAAPSESPAPAELPAPVATGSGDAATAPVAVLHPIRGTLLTAFGLAIPFLLMAADRPLPFSVPVGLLGLCLGILGIFDLLGTFDEPDAVVAQSVPAKQLLERLAEVAAAGGGLFVSLRLAVAGSLPMPRLTAAILVTTTFLALVVTVFRTGVTLGAWRNDEAGAPRPLLERHGFWVVAVTTLLYLPMLGSFSLSDPWETHYGEVAREMLARNDWISLWWAQDGWFWSKPVLDFWMQALSFSALGVGWAPDQMLIGAAHGRFPQPEWAARMPVFLLTVLAAYFLYKGVARVWGRRVGLLGGVVLATMPYWYLISHQTMTDMPYVAPLTAAMGLLLFGLFTDPEEKVRVYEIRLGSRTLRVSAYHLLFAAVLLLALPQVLYLATRNLTLQIEATPHGFRPHLDEFWSGSGGGNCGLPGNDGCREHQPVTKAFQPWHASLLWGGVTGLLLWMNRGERRKQRLAFLAAWAFVALSAMGKGAPGLVLPVFIAGAYLGATRRWRELTRLELLGLVLLVACITLPWYVQMYMRHGQPFTDRLLFHDMYKRAFVHVHDTNTGDDVSFRYYIWQLGYGLFPWTGLAAAGLVWWTRRVNDVRDLRGDAGTFMALWFISAFSMFTITLTKFHHYILPVVPPTAVLLGVMLDRMISRGVLPQRRYLPHYVSGLLLGALLLVYGISRLFPGSVFGLVVPGEPAGPPPAVLWIGVTSIAIGSLFGGGAALLFGRPRSPAEIAPTEPSQHFDHVLFGVIGLASAAVVGLAGRDMFVTQKGDIDGQARLMHLFTYNYRRPWPLEDLRFEAVLTAFTIASVALCALIAWRRFRTHAVALLLATSVVWAAWGINVYLVRAAPHWGQRETVLAYYADRPGPEAPLVAYQMNWKGENFYSGNRLPAFVASGQKFKDWVKQERERGVKVMYFTTEHGRVGSLKSELDNPADFEVLTSKELNNKFFVARVRFP